MKKLHVFILLFATLVGVQTQACTPPGPGYTPPTAAENIANADVVAKGRVSEQIETKEIDVQGQHHTYQETVLMIYEYWKKDVVPQFISYKTEVFPETQGMCPTFKPQTGVQYLFFFDYDNSQAEPYRFAYPTKAKSIESATEELSLLGQGRYPLTQMPTVYIPEFKKDLKIGMQNQDVYDLQSFLNRRGFSVAASGVGSKGKEGRYFGPGTRAALIRFQKANKITPASGYFGPVTRKLVNEMYRQ